jgi:glycosyltransferase involved in cell wall biosynthesis
MRVLRVYHGGRDPQHRKRERALASAGVDVTLVVPREWSEASAERRLSEEPFGVVELSVRRSGDVNRHGYGDSRTLRAVIDGVRPDVLDIHEEPFSRAAQNWLRAAPADLPVVMYSAQNIDKRYPLPFSRYERISHRRVAAFYPCSRQAASVLRGKGFSGLIDVVDLGYDDTVFYPGLQSVDDGEIVLALVGRLVPEKGVADAVQVLARLHANRPARLLLRGGGPESARAHEIARSLGIADRVDIGPWETAVELASTYRAAHVVLVPSYATDTWTEQFGRVIVEAQACGAVAAGYATGAIPEVAGSAGAIASPGDVAELGALVAGLISDPHEFACRREAGWAKAATRTWSAVAARQALLYAAARTNMPPRLTQPSSPRARRAAAVEEFGATAPARHGLRPFAMPLLRRGGALPSALGAVGDAGAELAARLSDRGSGI